MINGIISIFLFCFSTLYLRLVGLYAGGPCHTRLTSVMNYLKKLTGSCTSFMLKTFPYFSETRHGAKSMKHTIGNAHYIHYLHTPDPPPHTHWIHTLHKYIHVINVFQRSNDDGAVPAGCDESGTTHASHAAERVHQTQTVPRGLFISHVCLCPK